MKKILLFLSVALISLNVNSAELIPFSEYKINNPNWASDISEVAYIGTRCACLYGVLGEYLIENNAKGETLLRGKAWKEKSVRLGLFGYELSKTTGMSNSANNSRQKDLIESYAEKIKQNKRLNNNAFSDEILYDTKFCNKAVELFEDAANKAAGERAGNK